MPALAPLCGSATSRAESPHAGSWPSGTGGRCPCTPTAMLAVTAAARFARPSARSERPMPGAAAAPGERRSGHRRLSPSCHGSRPAPRAASRRARSRSGAETAPRPQLRLKNGDGAGRRCRPDGGGCASKPFEREAHAGAWWRRRGRCTAPPGQRRRPGPGRSQACGARGCGRFDVDRSQPARASGGTALRSSATAARAGRGRSLGPPAPPPAPDRWRAGFVEPITATRPAAASATALPVHEPRGLSGRVVGPGR